MTRLQSVATVLLPVSLFAVALCPTMEAASEKCPVTLPNGEAPPGQHPSSRYHGNGALWTVLWPEGKVMFSSGGSGYVMPDGSLSMKFPWWRGVQGKLTIEGRRLDAPAPPLKVDIPEGYADVGFQASALIFPTTGCWEITAKVGETRLILVTLVGLGRL
jgi:hypothetical protein